MLDPKVLGIITGAGALMCGVGSLASAKMDYDKRNSLQKIMDDMAATKQHTQDITTMMSLSPQFQPKKETGITADQLQETLITTFKALMPQQPPQIQQQNYGYPQIQQNQNYGYGYGNHNNNNEFMNVINELRQQNQVNSENAMLRKEIEDLRNQINQNNQNNLMRLMPMITPQQQASTSNVEQKIDNLTNAVSALVSSIAQQPQPQVQQQTMTDAQVQRILLQMGYGPQQQNPPINPQQAI